MSGRSAIGSWCRGRFSARSLDPGSWCSATCGSPGHMCRSGIGSRSTDEPRPGLRHWCADVQAPALSETTAFVARGRRSETPALRRPRRSASCSSSWSVVLVEEGAVDPEGVRLRGVGPVQSGEATGGLEALAMLRVPDAGFANVDAREPFTAAAEQLADPAACESKRILGLITSSAPAAALIADDRITPDVQTSTGIASGRRRVGSGRATTLGFNGHAVRRTVSTIEMPFPRQSDSRFEFALAIALHLHSRVLWASPPETRGGHGMLALVLFGENGYTCRAARTWRP
jgi:hypothetical protein